MLNEDYREMLHALSDEGVAKKWSRIRLTDSMKSKAAKVRGVPHFRGGSLSLAVRINYQVDIAR